MFGFCRNCLKSDCLKSLVFVTRFFEKDQTLVKNIESLFKFGSVEATAQYCLAVFNIKVS